VSRNLRHYPSPGRLDNILVRNGANSTLVKNNDLKVEGAAVAADFPTPNLSLICLLRPLMRLQWSRKNYRDAISVMTAENIFWSEGHVTREQRWARNGHKGCVVWLTGLPGAGKSTLSRVIERELFARGLNAFVLDGDNLRHGLNSNLGFSPPDRTENIRRTAEEGSLLASAGHVAIIALISPYRLDRSLPREIARAGAAGLSRFRGRAFANLRTARSGIYTGGARGEDSQLDRSTLRARRRILKSISARRSVEACLN
jgi:hypothetical protein